MDWGNDTLDREELEDAPLQTVSRSSLVKLHQVRRSVPNEAQAKLMRGIKDPKDTRYFSK